MFPIAMSEFRMLVRNKLVAACSILIPLALGVFFVFSDNEGGTAVSAVIVVLIMISMGVYVTATTTLAARRQTLFLKRLRSGVASDRSIILGLVAPIVLVSVVQVAVILVALAVTSGTAPTSPLLVALAVVLAEIMFAGLALATAGVTNSPEHAQVTTLPLFFASVGTAFWVVFTGVSELAWVKRALPGGGIAELIMAGWTGAAVDNLAVLVVPSLAWAVIAAYVARAMFRWEPRA
jgi:ABC-2 type transport system permease protein